jgi:hypothetical protein
VTVLVEITAPLGALGLLEGTRLRAGTEVQFEQRPSIFDCGSASLVVTGSDREPTVEAIESAVGPDDVELVTETERGTFYWLTWGDGLPELLERVRETETTVLSATATTDRWRFELRFSEQEQATQFYERYDGDHPITVYGVSASDDDGTADDLTEKQRSTLCRAWERGYFEVPRRVSLSDLADEMAVSDTAVSQRLRRGLENVLRESRCVHIDGETDLVAARDD